MTPLRSLLVKTLLLLPLLLLFAGCTLQQPASPPYGLTAISARPATLYETVRFAPDGKTVLYSTTAATASTQTSDLDMTQFEQATTLTAVDLGSMETRTPAVFQGCSDFAWLTDSVLICLPKRQLIAYPSLTPISFMQGPLALTNRTVAYVWQAKMGDLGVITRNSRWYLIDLATVNIALQRVEIGGAAWAIAGSTPVFAPDRQHYYTFSSEKVQVYSAQDHQVRWEARLQPPADVILGWTNDSCSLIYYERRAGEPLYALNVPCATPRPTPTIIFPPNPVGVTPLAAPRYQE
jgi:hypothetical protein